MSSLFGGKPFGQPASNTGAAGTGGLFGAANTGNATNNAPNNTNWSSTLFGGPLGGGPILGGSNVGQPSGSILGGNSTLGGAGAANEAPKPSPFANLNAQPPVATGGGLFGATTQTPPQPSAGGGLFSNANTTKQASNQAQIGTGTLGGLGLAGLQTSQAHPGGLAGLGGLGASQQAGSSVNNSGAAPSGTTGYFDSLLAKNKKRVNGEAPLEDFPSLQLGMGDLRQKLRKFGPRAHDPQHNSRAHFMLAASGVDPGAALKDLNYFDIQTGRVERPPPTTSAAEMDVDTYLANLETKTTLSMIADGLERSVRDFDSFLEDNVTMEWEAQRKRIHEHFGINTTTDANANSAAPAGSARDSVGGFGRSKRSKGPKPGAPERASVFGRSNMHKSVIGTSSRIGPHAPEFTDMESQIPRSSALVGSGSYDDRGVREKQTKLANCVRELNNARVQKQPFPVLFELAEIESQSGDRHAQHVVDAYRAAMEIVDENPEAESFANNATARERQFAPMYLDIHGNSQTSVAMRKRILKGASQFLEAKFFQDVEALIARYPKEANLGGRPDVVSKIKAYIRLRYARKDLVPDNTELQQVNGEYPWVLLFYLLRSGHVMEAAEYVRAQTPTFLSIDRTFSSYLLEYASSDDRRLRRQLQDRCNNEYTQRARNAPENSIDPFRMACYKIVGRCDLNNRQLEGLNTDIFDWVWLQFNLARENDKTSELAGESFTLKNLQESVREIGLKHFPKSPAEDTNGAFGMYFFLQVISGQFEQAVAYLYPFSYIDAIHFAIGLGYYGLLRTADPFSGSGELLSFSTRSEPQLSFGRMLGYYTRDFRAANVVAAVDYLVLICLNADLEGAAGRQQAELCHQALQELVLETREFSRLIGDIRPDGHRIAGLIEEKGSIIGLQEENEFVHAVTFKAARFADDNGRTTDAVLLYHLAEDYDSVVIIVSRSLGEAISLDIGENPMRLMPVKPRAAGKEVEGQSGSSLSLAAIDDPVDLARTMMTIYEKDAMFFSKIQAQNRTACHLLLQMSEIKAMVEAGHWPESLDRIRQLGILPLDVRGNPSEIRHYASKFSALSQPVAMNVPNLLMWTITCCVKQRERLMSGQYSGNDNTRKEMCEELKQTSMDLTTYTSQLKYRFPPHLHQALAKASAD